MIAVLFEVVPRAGQSDRYFERAAELLPTLEKIDGFISVERFQSTTNPEKFISISFWRDETAVEEWYRVDVHHAAQEEGREHIFKNYRIHVAEVFRDYNMKTGRPGTSS